MTLINGVRAGKTVVITGGTHGGEYPGVDATVQGCWYPCVSLEEQVRQGQKIGEIRDCFGSVLCEYYAPRDGVVLYVIASLAINPGDPLIALG